MPAYSELLFNAGSIFVPLVFGLIPALLPPRVAPALRWALWLAVVAAAAWYGLRMAEAPDSYRTLAWGMILVSAGLSLIVLLFDTRAYFRRKRRLLGD